MKRKVYISGALTGIEHPNTVKAFYESLGMVCDDLNLVPYIPHQHTDPQINSLITSQQVYLIDKFHIATAGLVIAYVGIPSIGVGQEIEIARENGIPVILLCDSDKPLSRMARGNPAVVAELRFSTLENAYDQVHKTLSKAISNK